jgi:hypothetical protein
VPAQKGFYLKTEQQHTNTKKEEEQIAPPPWIL